MKSPARWLAVLMVGLSGCVSSMAMKAESLPEPKARKPVPLEQRKKVAICDFEDKTTYGRGRLGTAAVDILTEYLTNSDQFRMFERQRMKDILDEQKLGQSGVIDPATAARAGRVHGVQYIVYGVVDNFGVQAHSSNALIYQKKVLEATCNVVVRIMDAETGEVIYSKNGRGVARTEATGSMGLGGRTGYDEKLAGDSMRVAIASMIDNLMDKMGAAEYEE